MNHKNIMTSFDVALEGELQAGLLLIKQVTFDRVWKWQSVNFMKSVFSQCLADDSARYIHQRQWFS